MVAEKESSILKTSGSCVETLKLETVGGTFLGQQVLPGPVYMVWNPSAVTGRFVASMK